MKNFRRVISTAILFFTPVMLFAGRSKQPVPASKHYIAYVGTYTTKTDSKGIYSFRLDTTDGKMTSLELAGVAKDPSWVVVHPSGKYLYAANEMGDGSTVSAFSIDRANGKLTLLNSTPALGKDPCHLSFDHTGKFLLVANYTSGNVVVFPIGADGKLGEHTAAVTNVGKTGPDEKRQDGPHAHWVRELWGMVFVADLGLDRILVYKFDSSKGTLGAMPDAGAKNVRPQHPIALSPGTGPRHVAISEKPDQDFAVNMYVLGELDSTVTVFSATKEGTFGGPGQTVRMLPKSFLGRNDAAEIELHPSGKFLYASNRGEDSIVVYAIDAKTGKLTEVEDVPTGGKEPRHFAIDPSGQFLLAENQNTNSIVEFRIDQATGKLQATGETLTAPSPICISFLPMQ
jgi:6-phosphogluconolactonase